MLALAVISSVLAGVASGWAATRLESTGERAARTQPPPPSAITAEVQRKVLVEELTLAGQGVPGRILEVPLPPLPEGVDSVITEAPVPSGAEVSEGQVLAEVGGRPVFLLVGPVPMYRDLKPGIEGEDVAQLQAALGRAGLNPGDRPGNYAAGTARAVTALYDRAGYDAPIAEPAGPGGVDQARETLAAAQGRLASARQSDPQNVPAVAAEVAAAERRLRELRLSTGAMIPRGELVFAPETPVRLLPPGVQVGQRPQTALLSLALGSPRIETKLPPGHGVTVDMAAHVEVEPGTAVPARVAWVGTSGPDASPVAHLAPGQGLPPEATSQVLPVRIELRRTPSEVLAVPVTAVFARPGGKSEVRVLPRLGSEPRAVEVRPGLSAGGFVEVQAIGGRLREGDNVLVGRE